MEYQFKPGYRAKVAAQVVGERLASLAGEHGTLTAGRVVDDARPADSPLHPLFDWNDTTAAEKYREEQARHLIRSVYPVHLDDEGKPQPVLGYVRVRLPDEGSCYVATARAMTDDELREQVLAEALSAVQALERRYRHLADLAPIFNAFRRVTRKRRKTPA